MQIILLDWHGLQHCHITMVLALLLCSTNAAFRQEWHGLLRNLQAPEPRLQATVVRGVVYRDRTPTTAKDTIPQTVTTFVVAELDPSTGKTYL